MRADAVRQMLGLADRTRVIDLFEHLVRGDIASAFKEFREQYDTGADPVVVLSDLAEFVNFVTRVKIVPATADNVAFGETERLRARDFAAKISMRVLSRMWQMLLKGTAEVQGATRPAAAAEMVLVRIAYVADMPTPDEAIRMIEQNWRRLRRRSRPEMLRHARHRPRPVASMPSSAGHGPVAAPRASAEPSMRPQMAAPSPERSSSAGAADRKLSRIGGACRRKTRFADQGRAGSRCAAGSHRGRAAGGGAGTQRRADADQRSVAQAGAMDGTALDRDRVQRSRASRRCGRRTRPRRISASAPPNPIRGCRKCWRDFPVRKWSRCAGLPPSRRNPMLMVMTSPTRWTRRWRDDA